MCFLHCLLRHWFSSYWDAKESSLHRFQDFKVVSVWLAHSPPFLHYMNTICTPNPRWGIRNAFRDVVPSLNSLSSLNRGLQFHTGKRKRIKEIYCRDSILSSLSGQHPLGWWGVVVTARSLLNEAHCPQTPLGRGNPTGAQAQAAPSCWWGFLSLSHNWCTVLFAGPIPRRSAMSILIGLQLTDVILCKIYLLPLKTEF